MLCLPQQNSEINEPLLGFLSSVLFKPFLVLRLVGKAAKLLIYLYIIKILQERIAVCILFSVVHSWLVVYLPCKILGKIKLFGEIPVLIKSLCYFFILSVKFSVLKDKLHHKRQSLCLLGEKCKSEINEKEMNHIY